MVNSDLVPLNLVVDGIKSVSVHNGLARVLFIRLDAAGQPLPVVELNIPMNQMSGISAALGKVK
jgi:hypothetical protein